MKLRLIFLFLFTRLILGLSQENCVVFTKTDTVHTNKVYCLKNKDIIPDSIDLYLIDFVDFLNDSTQLLFEQIFIYPNYIDNYYFDPKMILNLEERYEWQDSLNYYLLYEIRNLQKEDVLVYEIHFTSSFQAYYANRVLNRVFSKEGCPSNVGPCFFDWIPYKDCLFFFSSNPVGEVEDLFLERTVAKIRYFLLSINREK